ncbi:MAG: hypothetical protein ACRC2J_08240 [Microcoleaceae cyanobacterium]
MARTVELGKLWVIVTLKQTKLARKKSNPFLHKDRQDEKKFMQLT